jgi:hypothetical protein
MSGLDCTGAPEKAAADVVARSEEFGGMTQPSNEAGTSNTGAADEDAARKRTERLLVFVVSFLGLLIVAGITAVVLRIIYLSSTSPAQRELSQAEEPMVPQIGVPTPDRLDLPAGAVVKSVSVGGDRLAVHYEAPGGAGIAIVDLATGSLLRQVEIVPSGTGR